MQGEFVAAQAEYLRVLVLDQILQQSANGDQQLVARTVAEIVVDVLEMIDVHQCHGTFFAVGQRRFQRFLQGHAIGQPGQAVVSGQTLDLQRRVMLFSDIARGSAQSDDAAFLVVRYARVDADPAVRAAGGNQVREVVLHFAILAQRRQEAAVGHVLGAGFEIEEAAAEQVPGPQAEQIDAGVVQVGEAAQRIGRPDQVVGSLDQVAVARFAFQQQLDDAAFFLQGAARGGELVFDLAGFRFGGIVLLGAGDCGRTGQPVDDFTRITAVAAFGPARD